MAIAFNQNFDMIACGPLKQRTRYSIMEWLDNNVFTRIDTSVVNKLSKRWYRGSFSDYLYNKGIYHDI